MYSLTKSPTVFHSQWPSYFEDEVRSAVSPPTASSDRSDGWWIQRRCPVGWNHFVQPVHSNARILTWHDTAWLVYSLFNKEPLIKKSSPIPHVDGYPITCQWCVAIVQFKPRRHHHVVLSSQSQRNHFTLLVAIIMYVSICDTIVCVIITLWFLI